MKDRLLQFRMRRPFVPFRVVLSDGETIEITKPWSIGCGLTTVHIIYPDRRRHKMVHVDQIVAAEPLETVP